MCFCFVLVLSDNVTELFFKFPTTLIYLELLTQNVQALVYFVLIQEANIFCNNMLANAELNKLQKR